VTQGNEWPHTGGQPGGANQNHAAGGISTVSSLSDPANNLLYAALDLAAEGWAVFPCKWWGDDAKRPLTLNGHHGATRDPTRSPPGGPAGRRQ
jgi:hypothetical protein